MRPAALRARIEAACGEARAPRDPTDYLRSFQHAFKHWTGQTPGEFRTGIAEGSR